MTEGKSFVDKRNLLRLFEGGQASWFNTNTKEWTQLCVKCRFLSILALRQCQKKQVEPPRREILGEKNALRSIGTEGVVVRVFNVHLVLPVR